jgi:hypothetical protein
VLRAYAIASALAFFSLLLHREWLWGVMLFVVWFLISVIGSGVEKPRFYWGEAPAVSIPPSFLSHEDSYLIAKATFRAATILAVVGGCSLIRSGTHWYFAFPLGWFIGILAIVLPTILVRVVMGPSS